MNPCDQSTLWRAGVQPGCKGTVIGHRIDSEFHHMPATVTFLLTDRNGLDMVVVQYDGVAEDCSTFFRNIAGFKETFRRNRKGNWISLDRRPNRYLSVPERSNQFCPGAQMFSEAFPF